MSKLVSIEVEAPAPFPVPAVKVSDMLVVVDQDTYEAGVSMVAEVKSEWKKYDDARTKLKAGALQACKDIDNFFRPALTYLAAEEATMKGKLLAYTKEQDRIRQAAIVAAEKAAADERARLEKIAAKLEKKGDNAGAFAVRDEIAVTTAVHVPVAVEKANGASQRGKWVVEITDKAAFLYAALSNDMLMGAITIDTGMLARTATALGAALTYPGLKCTREQVLSIRSKSAEPF